MPLSTIMHFSLMDISVVLIILGIITARNKSGTTWLKKHVMINMAGALSAMTALIIMFLYKTSMGYPHFGSPHAIAGLITMVFLLTTPIMGNLLTSGKTELRNTHRYFGRATAVLMIITAVLGALRILQILQVL